MEALGGKATRGESAVIAEERRRYAIYLKESIALGPVNSVEKARESCRIFDRCYGTNLLGIREEIYGKGK